MKIKRYTKVEDDILRADYHRLAAAEIGRRIGRSEGSVRQRAKVLGLSRRVKSVVDLTPAERVYQVELKRLKHAARIAGRPLERWLERRVQSYSTAGKSKHYPNGCWCACHKRRAA